MKNYVSIKLYNLNKLLREGKTSSFMAGSSKYRGGLL